MPKPVEIIEGKDDAQKKALFEKAKLRFATENIGFLFAVNIFRKKSSGWGIVWNIPNTVMAAMTMDTASPPSTFSSADEWGHWIYNSYLKEGASKAINVSFKGSKELAAIAAGRKFPSTSFDNLYQEVGALVNSALG